ncbi:MAG: ABC transporter ATP-binding protein [Hornefia sp.]|nr:ABC transporter ATP-binding protein [Hornefia sp.]
MLEIKNVTKILNKRKVLDEVSYTFNKGTIYGLYGANGSGKTMLLRLVSGLIVPTEGEVYWNNKKLHEDISFPGNVGIVIENMEMLPQYTAKQNLKILSRLKNIATEVDIENVLKRVGLEAAKDLNVKKYSLGMKQRLNIAQAIFEKQDLILLDEPTNALDEEGIKLIYDIMQEEKKRGATIIIATHHKEDLANMCDVLINVKNGKIY